MLLILLLSAFLSSSQAFQQRLSDIECQYSQTFVQNAKLLDVVEQLDRSECLVSCFFTPECTHVAYDDETNLCRLLHDNGPAGFYPEGEEVLGNIGCESIGSSAGYRLRKRHEEYNYGIVAIWNLNGICCGIRSVEGHNGTKQMLAKSDGFSMGLCFANCLRLECNYVIYVPETTVEPSKCEIYNVTETFQCPEAPHSKPVTKYCEVKCYEGASFPPDFCNPMTTTLPTTSTSSPNGTLSTRSTFSTPTIPTTSVVSTTTKPPVCQQDCVDPCNLKVETKGGKNLTTTVCRHGKCTSKYIGNNKYTFRCDCFSPSDIPPFCTPACATTTAGPTTVKTKTTPRGSTGRHAILLIGGVNGSPFGMKLSMELYTPSKNSSEMLDVELRIGRKDHASAMLDDGRILVAGGVLKSDVLGITDSAEIVNLDSPKAKKTSSLKTARKLAAAATDPVKGGVVVCGGLGQGDMTLKSCEKYNNDDGDFKLISDMIHERKEFAMVPYNGDRVSAIFAIGGTDQDGQVMRSVDKYEYVSAGGKIVGVWIGAAPMINGHKRFGAANMGDYIVVVGGDGNDQELGHVEKYSVPEDRWEEGMPMRSKYGIMLVALDGRFYGMSGDAEGHRDSSRDVIAFDGDMKLLYESEEALKTGRGSGTAVAV